MVENDLVLTNPNPNMALICVDLLSRILRQAKITKEDFGINKISLKLKEVQNAHNCRRNSGM